jgi:hypothetical protein
MAIFRVLPAAKAELLRAREMINAREIKPINILFMIHSPCAKIPAPFDLKHVFI